LRHAVEEGKWPDLRHERRLRALRRR
jgi:hypothetical protein